MIAKNKLNYYLRKFGFEIHGTGYIQSIKKQSFQEDTFKVQKEILKESCKVIFDVGANRGKISEHYINLFPYAAIYGFEPFPGMYELYKRKFENNKQVKPFEMALGNSISVAKFFVNKNPDTNSLLASTKMGLSSDELVAQIKEIEVNVNRIDDFCKEHGITQIDILKLDIQGGELAALKGAESMLSSKKIKLIYAETYFRQQYKEQPLFHDISKYLETVGYAIQDFYNPIYGKGSIAWCDVIFLPKE